jgi:histidinol-phosphate phosphatase family protein
MRLDLVIPTTGRPSLARLLGSIDRAGGAPGRVLIVDDRPSAEPALTVPPWAEVLRGRAAGPAAARNRGWRSSEAPWVVFLDDDTQLTPSWFMRLAGDLQVGLRVAGSQGQIIVPRPPARAPTDAERVTIGLEAARYATADMALRRSALERVGGFDERFPRAYREDADLALRLMDAGYVLVRGRRQTVHPLGAAGTLSALRRQAGNRDDVFMRARHGRDWRQRAGAPRGRLRRHLAVTAAGLVAPALLATGRRRAAGAAGAAWLVGTAEFAWARIAPGPPTAREIGGLAVTSLAIPPLAVWHAAAGIAELPRRRAQRPQAVLLDRDGTLIVDVPYNGDPDCVQAMPGAADALARLRRAQVPTAVVTNQSGIARGLLSHAQVDAVNRRVEQLLGPLGPWFVCPHGEADGCRCRKPLSGMVAAAARALGRDPRRSAMIGDTGADMEAARGAGVRGVMVPTSVTLPHEVAEASDVAHDLREAVDLLLGAGA